MDAVTFPPPPAPFLDEDLDSASWDRPPVGATAGGRLELGLFASADRDNGGKRTMHENDLGRRRWGPKEAFGVEDNRGGPPLDPTEEGAG